MHSLLKELHRILKDDGIIIAVREPILPSLPILQQIKKMRFGRRQIAQGDIENTYTISEWTSHFKKTGFHVDFHNAYNSTKKDSFLKSYLNLYNGILYNRKYLIARKILK